MSHYSHVPRITVCVFYYLYAVKPAQAQHVAFSDGTLVKVITVSRLFRPGNTDMIAAPDISQAKRKKLMIVSVKMQTRIFTLLYMTQEHDRVRNRKLQRVDARG